MLTRLHRKAEREMRAPNAADGKAMSHMRPLSLASSFTSPYFSILSPGLLRIFWSSGSTNGVKEDGEMVDEDEDGAEGVVERIVVGGRDGDAAVDDAETFVEELKVWPIFVGVPSRVVHGACVRVG